MTANESLVLDFLRMLEKCKSPDELEKYYHPDIEQIEFPNAITKSTTLRNIKKLKDAFEKGSKILKKEEYEIKNMLSVGNSVILECIWKGTLAVPLGNIPIGGHMIAYFAQIFEFKDGKIYRQRNYDCFEPFL